MAAGVADRNVSWSSALPSKIFITGVAGFLGSHLADAMLALGHTVVGVDNLIGGELDNVPEKVDFHQIDCNNIEALRVLMRDVSVVYHCAATAYEGLSVFSPHIVTQNIVSASVSVFSAAIANKVSRIVHCSSMARYGALRPPFMEAMICAPQDPYGIGKLCAEQILKNLCETHSVEYVIAVPHNIIGPRQKYDDPYRNVASIMINRMLQGKPPVIYGDGTQERCFSYVDDCLHSLVQMGWAPFVVGEVINIGPDEEPITINTLAKKCALITDYKGGFINMPGRPKEVKHAICSSGKARRLLGYETKTTLNEGLKRMVDYIKARGTRHFKYHLPLEIVSSMTPETWTKRLF